MNTAHSTRTTEELLELIRQQEALIAAYGTSHLGIFSGPAIRYELAQLRGPVDLVIFDWRKQNEWNTILGWNPANVFLSQAARVDYAGLERRHAERAIDVRGQWGGDEIVIAVDAGHGRGLLCRLLRELVAMNQALTPAQVASIRTKTGGLISGFCVAAVLVEASTDALGDATRAIDATGALKAGHATGCRATSGARGTVVARLGRA
jgi:hypothetical protein